MDDVEITAFRESRRLGHKWVGAEHLLLAIAKQAPGSPARDALGALELDESDLHEYLRQLDVSADDLGDSSSPNPRFYGLVGRAQGFALAGGSARPLAEHFLLALIWDADSTLNVLMRERGVSPAEAQDALARQGVRVPTLTPPLRLNGD